MVFLILHSLHSIKVKLRGWLHLNLTVGELIWIGSFIGVLYIQDVLIIRGNEIMVCEEYHLRINTV